MEQDLKQKPMILYAKNEINTVPLKRLSKTEIDLFFYLCFSLNEKEEEKAILNFSDIKKILDFKRTDIQALTKLIVRTHKKLLEINFTIEEKDEIISFPIFYEFKTNASEKKITIQVHPRFQHVLNYFKKGNFTRINLLEIISLKSDYSKKLYPILKQFESTGEVYYFTDKNGEIFRRDLKSWREILCIPEAYDYRLINRKILTPVIKELSKYFPNLKIKTKINGRKITHIGFTFKPLIKEEVKNIINNNENKFKEKEINSKVVKQDKKIAAAIKKPKFITKEKSILSAFDNKKTIITKDNNSWLNNCDNN